MEGGECGSLYSFGKAEKSDRKICGLPFGFDGCSGLREEVKQWEGTLKPRSVLLGSRPFIQIMSPWPKNYGFLYRSPNGLNLKIHSCISF